MSELPESIDRMVGFWVRGIPYQFVKTGDGDDWTAYSRYYYLYNYHDEIEKKLKKIQASCQNEFVKGYFGIGHDTDNLFVEGRPVDDYMHHLLNTLHASRFSIKEKYTPIDVDEFNRIEAFLEYCAMEIISSANHSTRVDKVLDIECVQREAPENGIKIDYDLREWVEGMNFMKNMYIEDDTGNLSRKYAPLVFIPQYIAKTINVGKLTDGEVKMLWDIASENGYGDIIKVLHGDVRIDANMKNYTMQIAARSGYFDIVKLLLTEVNIDVKNIALRIAAGDGHLDIINLLLEEEGIDPEQTGLAHELNSLSLAARFGDINIVNRLLDYGLDPSAEDNQALDHAAITNHLDIVNRLLQDNRVGIPNHTLFNVITSGYYDVAKRLLEDDRVNLEAKNNALRFAAEYGRLDIVNLLLDVHQVDPSADSSAALASAAWGGYLPVVNRLLKDKRVDPAVGLERARQRGHSRIIKRLLRDKRISETDKREYTE